MSEQTPEMDALVSTLTVERGLREVSMREVARAAGVSPSCVHSWEHGTRAPSLHNLRAWAASLGYDLTLTRACPCGCPEYVHIGEIGCPCGLPDEPPCAPPADPDQSRDR